MKLWKRHVLTTHTVCKHCGLICYETDMGPEIPTAAADQNFAWVCKQHQDLIGSVLIFRTKIIWSGPEFGLVRCGYLNTANVTSHTTSTYNMADANVEQRDSLIATPTLKSNAGDERYARKRIYHGQGYRNFEIQIGPLTDDVMDVIRTWVRQSQIVTKTLHFHPKVYQKLIIFLIQSNSNLL